MARFIRMPEVLANVTEAAVQSWLVSAGDSVSTDTPLAEVETEKAMVEISADYPGTVESLMVEAGETVAVGSPIAILREPGDSDEDVRTLATEVGHTAVTATQPTPVGTESSDAPTAPPHSSTANDDAPFGSADRSEGKQFASPLVRRLAREHQVDLGSVVGTGPGGRIVRRDLENVLKVQPDTSLKSPAVIQPVSSKVPLTGMRKAIARRLTESKSTVPHFYLTAHCHADRLLSLRREVNEQASRKVSLNDFVLKAAALALQRVPDANRIWGGAHIEQFTSCDIAVAVSIDGGLITPVVRAVESLSLTELSQTVTDLADRGRAGKLRQDELEGGSFSVSNLGMYGIDEFSAILNPPQSGILAVGTVVERPIVVNGELAVGQVMTVTLSADHRVVDGATAAEWMAAFKSAIEAPLQSLI